MVRERKSYLYFVLSMDYRYKLVNKNYIFSLVQLGGYGQFGSTLVKYGKIV